MEQLLENMQEQQQIVQELISTVLEERAAILGRDPAGIESSRHKKEALQIIWNKLEEERQRLTNGRTLRQVAAEAATDGTALLLVRREFNSFLRELQSLNNANMLLLRSELAYISQLRNLLTEPQRNTSYTSRGVMAKSGKFPDLLISALA